MRQAIFLLILWIVGTSSSGQTLQTTNIGSAGTLYNQSNGSLHFNIGEISIEQYNGLREGLLQYLNVSSLAQTPKIRLEVNLYPVPTTGYITLESTDDRIAKWLITDSRGIVLNTIDHKTYLRIDLSHYADGNYYAVAVMKFGAVQAIPFQIIH